MEYNIKVDSEKGSDDITGIHLPFVNTVMELDYYFQEDICCMMLRNVRIYVFHRQGKTKEF
jgi:hypothetical protein